MGMTTEQIKAATMSMCRGFIRSAGRRFGYKRFALERHRLRRLNDLRLSSRRPFSGIM